MRSLTGLMTTTALVVAMTVAGSTAVLAKAHDNGVADGTPSGGGGVGAGGVSGAVSGGAQGEAASGRGGDNSGGNGNSDGDGGPAAGTDGAPGVDSRN